MNGRRDYEGIHSSFRRCEKHPGPAPVLSQHWTPERLQKHLADIGVNPEAVKTTASKREYQSTYLEAQGMKYKCNAHIVCDFTVEADSLEEAEAHVFECMADDVSIGIIDTSMFEASAGALDCPMLQSVELEPVNDSRAL